MKNRVLIRRLVQLTELIQDGQTCLLVLPYGQHDLVETIRELSDDPEKNPRLGNEGARQALIHHTWDREARQIVELAGSVRPAGRRAA